MVYLLQEVEEEVRSKQSSGKEGKGFDMSEIAHHNFPASARSKRAMLRSKASGTAIAVSEHAQKQKVFDK